jgi:nucleotide-binding universal stress UspA family protein
MKRILLATDGSKDSPKVLSFATEMAERYEARLDILHVVPGSEVPAEILNLVEADEIEEPPAAVYLEKVGQKIVESCGQACRKMGLKEAQIKTFILRGDPAHRIVEFAEEKQVEAIVMGNRGLGSIRGRLLGSVSRKVTHYAKCTCVIVK